MWLSDAPVGAVIGLGSKQTHAHTNTLPPPLSSSLCGTRTTIDSFSHPIMTSQMMSNNASTAKPLSITLLVSISIFDHQIITEGRKSGKPEERFTGHRLLQSKAKWKTNNTPVSKKVRALSEALTVQTNLDRGALIPRRPNSASLTKEHKAAICSVR